MEVFVIKWLINHTVIEEAYTMDVRGYRKVDDQRNYQQARKTQSVIFYEKLSLEWKRTRYQKIMALWRKTTSNKY